MTLTALQDTTPDELLSAVLTAVLQDVKLRPEQLGDISVGEHTSLQTLCCALPAFLCLQPSHTSEPEFH